MNGSRHVSLWPPLGQRLALSIFSHLAGRSSSVLGEFVNRTIDDQYGDEVTGLQVTYTGLWSQGNNCAGCAAKPDNQSAHNGTWHDGTLNPPNGDPPLTFSFSFNGTAVYIYNILARLTLTDVNITLDGNHAGTFIRVENVSAQYVYNVPIFAMDSIPYGEHTLEVVADGPNATLVLFDYAVYTTNTTTSDDPPSQPGVSPNVSEDMHKTNVGAIAGGTVGGVGLIAICVIAWLLYRRRRHPAKRDKLSQSFIPDPFPASGRRSPLATTPSSEMAPSTAIADKAASSSPDESPSGRGTSFSTTEDALSLQQQIQFFRTQFEALRFRTSAQQTSYIVSSPEKDRNSESRTDTLAHASSTVASELALLRAEVAQLRIQQENNNPSSPDAPTSPDTVGLLRELAVLRSEIEEMRMHQDLSHLDPLPEYSPRVRSHGDRRRLPSAPEAERGGR